MRMNIHRKGKSCCELSISHYKNVCQGASFSIHILDKLEGDDFITGQRDFAMQKLRMQRKDYWMKKLRTIIYSYNVNERVKNSNLSFLFGKLFCRHFGVC